MLCAGVQQLQQLQQFVQGCGRGLLSVLGVHFDWLAAEILAAFAQGVYFDGEYGALHQEKWWRLRRGCHVASKSSFALDHGLPIL